MNKINQQVIPAVSVGKDFERFLDSSFEYGILMNMNVAFLGQLTQIAHSKGKKVLYHLDLINGLTNDEYGCEYACQQLKADGVISTRGKVVEIAKKNKKIAILRLFLIDTKSLEKGLNMCNNVKPDYMEVLPGIASSIIPQLKEKTDVDIMSGGLISSVEQIDECINNGAVAVTISNVAIANSYLEK